MYFTPGAQEVISSNADGPYRFVLESHNLLRAITIILNVYSLNNPKSTLHLHVVDRQCNTNVLCLCIMFHVSYCDLLFPDSSFPVLSVSRETTPAQTSFRQLALDLWFLLSFT